MTASANISSHKSTSSSDTRYSWLSSKSSTACSERNRAAVLPSPTEVQMTAGRQRGTSSTTSISGGVVQPGKVVSKAERYRRSTSGISPKPLKSAKNKSWWSTHVAQDTWVDLCKPFSILWNSSWNTLRHAPLQSLIYTGICFLLIFGALHTVFGYLLNLSRAAAQCAPLISYIPVTYTVTETVTPIVTSVLEESVGPTTAAPVTSTSTHYLTVVVSQQSPSNTAGPVTTDVYSYVVESGSTSWFASITPSSGQALITVTSTVYITAGQSQPVPSTNSVTAGQPQPDTSALNTATVPPSVLTLETATVSPPAYETTSYSAPDEDETTTLTTTRTTTISLSTLITNTRSSFTPVGSSGWNSTAEGPTSIAGTDYSIVSGVPTTITGTVYFSTGARITSTSYFTSTLTLTRSGRTTTITVTPPGSTLTITDMRTPSDVTSSSQATATSALISAVSGASSSQGYGDTSAISSSSSAESEVSGASSAATSLGPTSSGVSIGAESTQPAQSLPSSGVSSSQQTSPSESQSSNSASSVGSAVSTTPGTSASAPYFTSSGLAVSTSRASSSGPSSMATSSVAGSPLGSVSSSSVEVSSSTAPASIPAATSSAGYGLSSIAISSSGIAVSPQSESATGASTLQSASSGSLTTLVSTPISSSVEGGSRSAVTSVPISAITDYFPSTYSLSATSSSIISNSSPSSIPIASLPGGYGSPDSLSSTPTISVVSTSASSTISPTPSVCGEHGNFTLNFDDLPSFSTNDNNTDITQAPPIFNGYHHLAFSDGYVYAPPPRDPFPPISPPHLAVFLGNASGSGVNNTPTAMAPISGMIRPGEFGDGISDSVSAFWFNAYSAYLGCDNSGPEPCTYVLTAYAWNPTTEQELQVDTTNVTTSPCPGFVDCHLEQIGFPSTFTGLSGLQIQAYKGQDQVMFFMDDVSMGWYNNTCAAGLQRLRSQRGGTPAKK